MGEPEMTLAKGALSGALALVLVCVVALAALSVLGPLAGWHVNAVISGSMEPAVHTGDVIITRPVAPGQVAVGEIILFRPARGESFVAHRVVAVARDPDLHFVTKGDANNDRDPSPVSPGQARSGSSSWRSPTCTTSSSSYGRRRASPSRSGYRR